MDEINLVAVLSNGTVLKAVKSTEPNGMLGCNTKCYYKALSGCKFQKEYPGICEKLHVRWEDISNG